ncbi:MAG: bile acid:sodium symporter, partial [Myxococcales bacterium]
MKRLFADRFLLGMALAMALAVAFPEVGRSGGPLRPELLAPLGIALVFFLHGLGLPTPQLLAGLWRWKLHLVTQLCTFALFPLLFLAADALGLWPAPELRLGFLFLCALPSTISSSVAMTAIAGGNVAGAIFNASLSSLLGVVLTPALVALLARTGAVALPVGDAIVQLALLLVLPLLVGQLLRPVLGDRAGRLKKATAGMDRLLILLLVYASFCDSVASGVFRAHHPVVFLLTGACAAALLAAVFVLSAAGARLL